PSLLRQLHQLGCRTTVLCASKLDAGYASRYPRKKILVSEIRENDAAYRAAIEKELKEGYDFLFPVLERATDICTDGRIAAQYPELKILAALREAFLKAYDKQQTMDCCMDNQIPCPVTRREGESLEDYLQKVSFPLAAKPRRGSGSAGFKKVRNRQELEKLIKSGEIVLEDYVLQEFIPQDQYMCNCYIMMSEGRPIYTVELKTYRWYPIDGGPGCFARTVDQPRVRENAVRLFQALGWDGFGQVSFMMDTRDGVAKVTEINGRISAGIRIVEYAGCEPVRNLLDRACGLPLIPRREKVREGLGLRYFHTDLLWFLKSPKRFSAKPSWFDFRKNKDYLFSWGDPLPFFAYALGHMKSYKKDMAKRKH
ncbi:MAG: ATP-grasp domain-containing protein, partial [Lachnospiraceae bacterium]|nr:ATP-grasp domain-containing protein [Lachnospiraceae bacterium]